MDQLQQTIDAAWEKRAELDAASAPKVVREAVDRAIGELDAGRLRVAEKRGAEWITHQWLKKAVLLSFRLSDSVAIGIAGPSAPFRFYDKVPTKFARFDEDAFAMAGVGSFRPRSRAPRRVYRAERRADAKLRQHRRLRRLGNDGRHLGNRGLVRANRPQRAPFGAWASEESWNRCKPTPPLSRTIALLERAPKSSRASSSRRLGARYGCSSARAPKIYSRDNRRGELRAGAFGSVVVAGSLPSANGRCQLYCAVIVKQSRRQDPRQTSIGELLRA
jgi:2,3,4,5-tetrahydropyridine-2-carboxylate N-succinyltransferase